MQCVDWIKMRAPVVGVYRREFINLCASLTSLNTISPGPISFSSPSSPSGLSLDITTSSRSSPASLVALSCTSLNRPGLVSSSRYSRHRPGYFLKMLPLHQGSGCRQYTTVILPRKSSRMRRTVRPMPASPDASLGLTSTTAAPFSFASLVVDVTFSSDGGSGAANTRTSSPSWYSRRSLADAIANGASGHLALSIAAHPASGNTALTLESGPMRSHSCAAYSRVISQTLSWSPASAMTLPEMGSHSSGMRSSTRLPRLPLEMACSVAVAAVATASKRLSGSSSSSNFWVPSSFARPTISSLGAAGVAEPSAPSSVPSSDETPIF
mmetsp:Transcript_14833/g.64191  ORF Transcript_14833/g.64191 Transcript_14833/m.64191 type:complete len:325 (-) Transcript_14833:218-1192(-)